MAHRCNITVHRFCCWTLIPLWCRWAWLHWGYRRYRNFIDWLRWCHRCVPNMHTHAYIPLWATHAILCQPLPNTLLWVLANVTFSWCTRHPSTCSTYSTCCSLIAPPFIYQVYTVFGPHFMRTETSPDFQWLWIPTISHFRPSVWTHSRLLDHTGFKLLSTFFQQMVGWWDSQKLQFSSSSLSLIAAQEMVWMTCHLHELCSLFLYFRDWQAIVPPLRRSLYRLGRSFHDGSPTKG